MREKLKKRNLKRILKGINMGIRNSNDEALRLSRRIFTDGTNGVVINNSTQPVTISSVAPANVGTATISKWLIVKQTGTTYYIPMWT